MKLGFDLEGSARVVYVSFIRNTSDQSRIVKWLKEPKKDIVWFESHKHTLIIGQHLGWLSWW